MTKARGYNPGFENFVENMRRLAAARFWTRKPPFACELCDKEYEVSGKCQDCGSQIVLKSVLFQASMDNLENGWKVHKKSGWTATQTWFNFLREIEIKKNQNGGWSVSK